MEGYLFRQFFAANLGLLLLVLNNGLLDLRIDVEAPALLVADRALPLPVPLHVHEADEGLQVEALAVDAVLAPRRDVDQAPGEGVRQVDLYLLDLDFLLAGCGGEKLFGELDLIGGVLQNLHAQLVRGFLPHQVKAYDEYVVVPNLQLAGLDGVDLFHLQGQVESPPAFEIAGDVVYEGSKEK